MLDPFLTAARRQLSAFNHNSNLLVAGAEFAVPGDTPSDRAIRTVLGQMGAITVREVTPRTRVIWGEMQTHAAATPLRPTGHESTKHGPTKHESTKHESTEHESTEHESTGYPLIIADPTAFLPADARPGTAPLQAGSYMVDVMHRWDQSAFAAERVEWARANMPVTHTVAKDLSAKVEGMRVGLTLVLEPKTAVLALQLAAAGAEVAVFAPANETDAAVANYLRTQGITVFADREASPAQERELAERFLDWHPQVLVDDGAHLIRRAHQRPDVLKHLVGATEETTSGVRPLRSMEASDSLRIPVIAVNDARSKTFFDNRFGTGQTCAFAIYDHFEDAESTGRWLIVGFGPVGAGVAQYARALGAEVVVSEIDPVRALEARHSGFTVATLAQEIPNCDVVVSATGIPYTITREHLQAAHPGTVFAVAGGVKDEIEKGPWPSDITVLAGGHGVNYTAAEGNPIEIMDLSFACQLLAISELLENNPPPGIHALTKESDQRVSHLGLLADGSTAEPETSAMRSNAAAWENDRYRDSEVVVYSADLVIPVTAPRITNGAIAVKDGKILHVGERQWVLRALEDKSCHYTEQHWSGVITPGLINAHTHLQYTDMRAVGQSHYLGFDDWSKAFDEVYDHQEFDWHGSALRGAEMALQSGTTACADVVTDIGAAGALAEAGLHGIAYWEVMGWSNEDWQLRGRDQAIHDLQRIPRMPGVGVSPHAPYSLEVQPLLEVPDLVRNLGMRLHIHLGEAHFERETWPTDALLRRQNSDWVNLASPSFEALRRRGVGVSSTQFVDQLGVLGPDCHVAHGVYMSAEDRSLLRARGSSVALCPRSNQVIGLDNPPIADYLREGNQISVGTDSLSSSPSLDLLADVGLLYQIAREQGYAEPDLHKRLFTAATLGGAGALGLRAGKMRVGQLAVGASADLAFFSVASTDPEEALAELVEAGEGACHRTIIAGTTKYEVDR